MEKDSKGSDKKSSKDQGPPAGLDPNFFAHSLFGGATAGFNPMMLPGFPMMPAAAASAASSSSAAAHAALASMAGGPASLGSMTQANAAWLSLMHQMAAQDYLSRLQSGAAAAGFNPLAGLGYEALAGVKAPGGTSSGRNSSKERGGKASGSGGGSSRGRKKTISLDPPSSAGLPHSGALSHGVSSILGRAPATETRLTDSVTITPTSSKSTSDRLRELELLGTKVEIKPAPKEPGAVGPASSTSSGGAQVTITPVASRGTTMLTSSVSLTPVERGGSGGAGGGARSPPPSTDLPLNLSKKPPAKREKGSRGAAAEIAPPPYAAALGVPLTPEQQLEQFRSVMASAQQAMSEYGGQRRGQYAGGSGQRRSRTKQLGVGISRPKKNTVASLLASSRSSDDAQAGGSGAVQSVSTDELTIEVRPRSSTAPAATADDDEGSVKSVGSDKKHKVTSSTDDPLNSFPYSSYLARLKREYEDSSGLDSEELSANESECEVSSSKGTPPSKRRRVVTDERKLRVPLDRGWRRETTVRKITQAGPRGDVVYYAPCGKAFRQFPDILRYLERNNITDVSRDHFTFSSKVVIGDYLKISDDGEECISISEAEVRRQVEHLSSGKKKQFKKPYVINIKSDEAGASGSGAGAAASSNYQQAMELMRQLEEERRLRQLKEEQKKREKELRNAQLLEERRRKQEEMEKQKIAESVRKAQERSKQREMLYMLEVERERRRHHMLLVKALDTRRRQEERDRRRQDLKEERAALKEKRREKKALDADAEMEQARPREDMSLKDRAALPELPRIPGLQLAGEAFANCLMVFEFLHNFGETLGFDMESLPSLAALQAGLLNRPDHEEELLSVLTHLVVCAVEDPGIPHPVRHVTMLNQTLRQADITHTALSEVLRIYMHACAAGEVKTLTGFCINQRDPHCRIKNADYQDAMEQNRTNQISKWLAEKPFLALNPTEKSEILAHLCNDLLLNKAVLRQIDGTIESVNNKRKDKWMLEGRLRRLKMLHSKKSSSRSAPSRPPPPEATTSDAGDTNDASRQSQTPAPAEETAAAAKEEPVPTKEEAKEEAKEEEDDEEKEESGNESEPADDVDVTADDGDINTMTAEELSKRIEQLDNHYNTLSKDIYESNCTIRPTSLGLDRSYRTYWLLPRAGGVYVESLESGLAPEERNELRRRAIAERKARQKRLAESPPEKEAKKARVEPVKADAEEETCGSEPDRLLNGECAASPENGSDGEARLNGDCTSPAPRGTDPNTLPGKVKSDPSIKVEDGDPPVKLDPDAAERLPNNGAAKADSVSLNDSLGVLDTSGSVKAESLPVKAEPPGPGPAAPKLELGVSGSPLCGTEPSDTKPSARDSLTAIQELAKNPVPQTPPAKPAVTLSTPYSPQLNSKHIISYLNASLASLGANGSLREVNGAVQIAGLGLVPSQYLLQALQAPEKLWFSVLPKEPCDFSSLAEVSDEESEPAEPAEGAETGHNSEEEEPEGEAEPLAAEHVGGWWRVTAPAKLEELDKALHERGIRERDLRAKLRSYKDVVAESCSLGRPEEVSLAEPAEDADASTEDADASAEGAEKSEAAPERKAEAETAEQEEPPSPDPPGSFRPDVALTVEMALLEQVENLEERIAQASMQVKSWRLPARTSHDRSLFAPSCAPEPPLLNPVASARDRLVDLELNVERRYLKPPLGTSKGADLSLSNLGTEENNTIPRPLLVWRDAMPKASTAAQVSMCLYALEMSIAWDKSIMKANCQFCTSGDHEEKLLLCDGCDKGYHTYCFKPAMDTIPDGDWYCFECVNKATGERACVVCGKGEGKVLLCEGCPRAFHPECVTPPVTKIPRGKWHCPACAHKNPKKSRSKKRPSAAAAAAAAAAAGEPTEATPPADSPEKAPEESPPKKERGNKKLAKELGLCRSLLTELESLDDAWPFLLPVNTKQFPTYKKIIKNPMDLSTIKKRLNEGVYKGKEDFLNDMRIIFDNCETFNEDDSPVGKAGHAMRDLFEARWLELNLQ